MRPGAMLNFLPFLSAAILGSIKARYLFLPSCWKNLARIDALADPKIWQFFRPGFYIFLITMISLGVWLSRWASGEHSSLITVSSIDMTLSVGLFGSLIGFRAQGAGSGAQEGSIKYPEGKDVSG